MYSANVLEDADAPAGVEDRGNDQQGERGDDRIAGVQANPGRIDQVDREQDQKQEQVRNGHEGPTPRTRAGSKSYALNAPGVGLPRTSWRSRVRAYPHGTFT